MQLQQVTKAFHRGAHNELWAVRGVSLTLEAGSFTCFRGASGCGKTTLLSLVGTLSRPTSGRIVLNERQISGMSERFLTEIRRHTFGFIFQRFNLIPGFTVLENIVLPAYPDAPPRRALMQRADRLLEQFQMEDRRESRSEWLSGGEAQRVAIIRALINDPAVIIADEPTANLDSALSQEFMGLMEQLYHSGKTILLTSHDAAIYQAPIIDRLITLHDGRVSDDSGK
ncbi:MAG: ABC transporter ATP-binding protein [Gammaproteobacteria bacterium]|nr:ABC transporter ATP-binding protein [Gammaproteobacteria bacterium]